MLVPNASLRFTPVEVSDAVAETKISAGGGLFGGNGGFGGPSPGGGPGGAGRSSSNSSAEKPGTLAGENTGASLWYIGNKGEITSIAVLTGVTDGIRTEIIGSDILEGARIIEKIKVIE
ncbi:hypothetical protein [Marispirochaeta sp.]|uniref:hypothetical protein n=1 Tax=Marispirochaeta sp. TaxID=2038653 RepID=UPI0029C66A96|nr:hypothetical protein [Marispirochaeta sp.]